MSTQFPIFCNFPFGNGQMLFKELLNWLFLRWNFQLFKLDFLWQAVEKSRNWISWWEKLSKFLLLNYGNSGESLGYRELKFIWELIKLIMKSGRVMPLKLNDFHMIFRRMFKYDFVEKYFRKYDVLCWIDYKVLEMIDGSNRCRRKSLLLREYSFIINDMTSYLNDPKRKWKVKVDSLKMSINFKKINRVL